MLNKRSLVHTRISHQEIFLDHRLAWITDPIWIDSRMLQSLIISSGNGMTLFRKEFMPLPKPLGLLSGLLTAMIEKCLRETGLFISFIEYSKLSIALGTCTKNKLSCIIVYDQPDGQEFGQILVQEILYNFIRIFQDQLSRGISSKDDFSIFDSHLVECFRSAIFPALNSLVARRGIEGAMLVQNFDHCIEVSGETPDKVGVLANLESLINVSQDLMSIAGDNANFVIMESGAKRILITSIDQYQLIVSCKASADYLQCKGYIQETLYLVFNSNLLQCLIPLSPVII